MERPAFEKQGHGEGFSRNADMRKHRSLTSGRGKTGDDMRPGSETPSNVIIARITEGDYPITIDALYMLFSFYGKVQKVRTSPQSHRRAESIHVRAPR